MNAFNLQSCICECIGFIQGKCIGGNTEHIRHSPKYKASAITKKNNEKDTKKDQQNLDKKNKETISVEGNRSVKYKIDTERIVQNRIR